MKRKDDLGKFQQNLWTASCQVRALGEMLLFQHREPALDEEDVWHGYGTILRRIGERMEKWSKQLDEMSVRQAAKCERHVKRNKGRTSDG